ncbi:hypothetical protein ACTHGU_19600 [Chitinophagaceae bacterium MMS25-I14]
MKQVLLLLALLSVAGFSAQAQHHHHPAPKESPTDTSRVGQMAKEMAEMDMDMDDTMNMGHMNMGHSNMPSMSSAYSPSLPMSRNGSGTSWLPDASPMYGVMLHSKNWMYMIHGDIFVRYNRQDIGNKGSRGGDKWDAPDMLMFMGQRKVGQKGLFHFSTMFSADALIAGGNGYPLLFQSGETWDNKPLVDRQHPHDLFSELSVSYAYSLSHKADAFVYVGYPGEPALGPVTFMHRPSGMDNPDAPLGHHWEDATHITFGVATIGVRYGQFKLEGSSFTGREPDENRYNFDKPLFDSRSARLSFNPGKNWSLQVSHGFIKSPEALHPDEDVYRTTASATYSQELRHDVYFNATALWGMNKIKDHDAENAALLEASMHAGKLITYLRYEWVQKSTEELNLDEIIYGHDKVFPVNAFTLGAGYDLMRIGAIRVAGGAQFSVYHTDAALNSLYGKNPVAGELYLRFYPALMKM